MMKKRKAAKGQKKRQRPAVVIADYTGNCGFSLLEVIIAFVVLSISLAILTQSIGKASRQLRQADELQQLQYVATLTLAQTMKQEGKGGKGTDKETGITWEWQRTPVKRQDKSGALVPVQLLTIKLQSPSATSNEFVIHTLQITRGNGDEAP